MSDTSCEKVKKPRHPWRSTESLIITIQTRIKEWEAAGIIPKIRRGKVLEDEQKK